MHLHVNILENLHEDDSSSSNEEAEEEEDVGVALELPRRKSRGRRVNALVAYVLFIKNVHILIIRLVFQL